jgi:hypothetical protein
MEAKRPKFETESDVQAYACCVMDHFCSKVIPERQLTTCKYKVDVAGYCDKAKRMIYLECKRFHRNQNISEIADAIMQAKSYADALEYPVFVGPLFGERPDFVLGTAGALAALHLMAGHLNVGFFVVNTRIHRAMLLFKGQKLIEATPAREVSVHSQIEMHFRYKERQGSKVIQKDALSGVANGQ